MKVYLLVAVLFILSEGIIAKTIAVLRKNQKPVVSLMQNENQPVVRHKRQFGFPGPFGPNIGQSNSNSFGNFFGPNGFGSSNAAANAQSSNIKSPLGNFGQSSANANANAFGNYFGPDGFGSSSSLAGAQSFNSQGPFASFGGSAANSGSQNFKCKNFGGCSVDANQALSQSYKLPDGRTLAVALGYGLNFAPGQAPKVSNSNSFTITK